MSNASIVFAIKTNYTKTKTRKIKNADFIAEKVLPKKARGKKTKLFSKLETNDLHASCINSKVNINNWCKYKAIENQLKGGPSIKDLQIAKWLE